MRLLCYSVILLSLGWTSAVNAALDEHPLRADLIAIDTRVHIDPLGVRLELMEVGPQIPAADDLTRMWFLLRRAQVHNALFMYDEFDRDIASARALQEAEAPVSLLLTLDVYQGISEVRRGELQRGIETLGTAAGLAQQADEKRVYVFAVQELAYTLGLLEQYHRSLQDLNLAYASALELNHPDLIAMVNDAYGAVYSYMADYPRAIEYYELALAEFDRLDYQEQLSSVIQGLATTYRYAGQWQEAEKYFLMYLKHTEYAPGEHSMFYGSYGLAMTYALQGDCKRAQEQTGMALALKGPEDYKAELYKRQAICEARANNLSAADVALARATEILAAIPELDGTTWVLELEKIASLIEFQRGNSAQAYSLLSNYHDDYIKQMEQSSSNRMNLLRADLESEQKDLEISLLEQQAQLNQLQIEAHLQASQAQRYLTGLLIAISIAIFGGMVFQRRSNRRILALSHRDSLSGLYNRRYTFEYLEKVIPGISVNDGGMSILLLDIDNFKDVNDSFGHPTGDRVIKRIAAIGEQSLRNRDIMGRIGGEEFLCVLPRATAEQSYQVAQRLLDAISQEDFVAADGTHFSTSISIGIANYHTSIEHAEEFYARADQALYRSKAEGKGCITNFDG
jgi:diguanylate cyclase (GGDEF)-like protein